MRLALPVLLCATICGALTQPLAAQQTNTHKSVVPAKPQSGVPKPPGSIDKARLGVGGGETFNYDKLKAPPAELPALPNYQPPGAKYLFGLKSVRRGATDLQLYFVSTADAATVLEQYNASFSQPGWKKTFQKENQLSASFAGNTCSIRVTPGVAAGKRPISQVMIDYQFKSQ